ncbi:hypothetical protein SAMN04487829_2169 [Pseudobutyrivibrio sp. NOR37]|uniref:MucBP domain-containing protein n=1 Tax=Pseudobutyrivibrio xylanivorans TaxID=185007 RepID=A0A6M0LLM9_PSEXY|nr:MULTISPECIES: hypothetical protein [Pseudobutyrivibrio]NEX02707.1 hypothetical protein [Pseudobutyrivibrio xylanivorans]SFR80482.1 hypothetical protein SAMN04487829_2169 [Pseudobutyrivibrio sp. NOR37]
MKKAKKLLGLILTFVFVLTLANLNPNVAKAESYTYQVKILIGNNEDASFISEGVDSLKAKYGDERVSVKDDVLKIDELKYGEEIDIRVDQLIQISPNAKTGNTKYYLSGLRVSGGDTIVTQATKDADGNRAVNLNGTVEGDEDYVVAYGVGSTIPYTVKYVDADGNALAPDDIYWGTLGEIVLVPARHIDNYYPDALYRTTSSGLKENTVFTFQYTKNNGRVVYIDETTYSSDTVYGEPVYEYQYVNRGTRTADGGRTTRPAAGGGNGAANADANAGEDNAEAGDGNDGAGADETTIEDEQTPLDVIDIDDPDTAKHGETAKDNFRRNMIIGILIAIIAVVIILIALLVANKKRKAVIAKVEEKKDAKE